MNKIKIEKHVPIPKSHHSGRFSDLAERMQVGDSVVLAGDDAMALGGSLRILRAAEISS